MPLLSDEGLQRGHIVGRTHHPEIRRVQLDNVIANLELMPLRLNQSKGDNLGQQQRDLAKKLHAAGLFSKPKLD